MRILPLPAAMSPATRQCRLQRPHNTRNVLLDAMSYGVYTCQKPLRTRPPYSLTVAGNAATAAGSGRARPCCRCRADDQIYVTTEILCHFDMQLEPSPVAAGLRRL